jgi:hypothetical protein
MSLPYPCEPIWTSNFHHEFEAFGLGLIYQCCDLKANLIHVENFQARPLLLKAIEHREFGDLPDPRMENRFDENEMYHMIGAAAACIRHSAAMRPRMGQVVRALDSLADSNLNNGLQPGRSEVFLEPQSEEIRLFQLREFGSRDCSDEMSQASWRSRRDL